MRTRALAVFVAVVGLLLLPILLALHAPGQTPSEPRTLIIRATGGIRFDPDTIYVEPGEEVKLAFVVVGPATHTFTLFAEKDAQVPFENVALQDYYDSHATLVDFPLPPGTEDEVVLTAPSEGGTYVFVCMTTNHAEAGMHGRMIVRPNEPPHPAFTVAPPAGNSTTTFSVDASNSTDLHDATLWLEVRWDWEDDGTWDTEWTVTKTAEHRYAEAGTYTIRLEVMDRHASLNETARQVLVSPLDTEPPTIQHAPPASVKVGQALDIVATVTDAEGVEEVVLHYRTPGTSTFETIEMAASQDGSPANPDVYVASIPALTAPGTLEYHVEATDRVGNVAREPNAGEISVPVVDSRVPDAGTILLYTLPPLIAIGVLAAVLAFRRRNPRGVEGDGRKDANR